MIVFFTPFVDFNVSQIKFFFQFYGKAHPRDSNDDFYVIYYGGAIF
jgi:hypothetical protein